MSNSSPATKEPGAKSYSMYPQLGDSGDTVGPLPVTPWGEEARMMVPEAMALKSRNRTFTARSDCVVAELRKSNLILQKLAPASHSPDTASRLAVAWAKSIVNSGFCAFAIWPGDS